jgi:hypothetical protein
LSVGKIQFVFDGLLRSKGAGIEQPFRKKTVIGVKYVTATVAAATTKLCGEYYHDTEEDCPKPVGRGGPLRDR